MVPPTGDRRRRPGRRPDRLDLPAMTPQGDRPRQVRQRLIARQPARHRVIQGGTRVVPRFPQPCVRKPLSMPTTPRSTELSTALKPTSSDRPGRRIILVDEPGHEVAELQRTPRHARAARDRRLPGPSGRDGATDSRSSRSASTSPARISRRQPAGTSSPSSAPRPGRSTSCSLRRRAAPGCPVRTVTLHLREGDLQPDGLAFHEGSLAHGHQRHVSAPSSGRGRKWSPC